MKVLVLGGVHRKGTAKKTGNAYDFAVLHVARFESFRSNEKMQVVGAGLTPGEVRCTIGVVTKLQSIPQDRFPLVLELKVENDFGNFGQVEAVCSDFEVVASVRPSSVPSAGTRVAG